VLGLGQFILERGKYENSDFSAESPWLDLGLAGPSFGGILCDVYCDPDYCFLLALFLGPGGSVRALFLASAKESALLFLTSFFDIFLECLIARVAQMVRRVTLY